MVSWGYLREGAGRKLLEPHAPTGFWGKDPTHPHNRLQNGCSGSVGCQPHTQHNTQGLTQTRVTPFSMHPRPCPRQAGCLTSQGAPSHQSGSLSATR